MENTNDKFKNIESVKNILKRQNQNIYELKNMSVFMIDKRYDILILNERFQKYVKNFFEIDVKNGDNIYELADDFVKSMQQYETVRSFFSEVNNALNGEHITDIKIVYSKKLSPQYFELEYMPIKKNKEVVAVVVFIINTTNYENNKFKLQKINKKQMCIQDDIKAFLDKMNKNTQVCIKEIDKTLKDLMALNLEKDEKEKMYKLVDNIGKINKYLKNTNKVEELFNDKKKGLNKNKEKKEFRILIVDDNVVSRKLIYELLKKYDYESVMVSNAEEAFEKLKIHSYDLIFMDIYMPKMTGIEAVKIIRSINKYKDVPIIAMTAYEKEDEYFIKNGMNGCLRKPIKKEKLYKIMNNYRKKMPVLKVKNKNNNVFKNLEIDLDGNYKLVIELAEKLIDMFSEKNIKHIIYLANQNSQELENVVHKLRGTVLNFGLSKVEFLLTELTKYVNLKKKKDILEIIVNIKKEIFKFQQEKIKYEKYKKFVN